MIAPFNGDAFHGFATQVNGFDETPDVPAPSAARCRAIFETAGYRPAYPFWIYEIDFSSER